MKEFGLISEIMSGLRAEFSSGISSEESVRLLARSLSEYTGCDLVAINFNSSLEKLNYAEGVNSEVFQSLISIKGNSLKAADQKISIPVCVSDLSRTRTNAALFEYRGEIGSKSLLVLPFYKATELIGWVECHWIEQHVRLNREQLSDALRIVDYVANSFEETVAQDKPRSDIQHELDEALLRSKRLIEYGNIVLVRSDPKLIILDVLGDSETLLGLSTEEIKEGKRILTDFLHPDDVRLLARQLRRMEGRFCELKEEVRVRNLTSGKERWVMLTAVPRYNEANEFIGWEGFGVDISEKKKTERLLQSQSRRIEALYAVSQSLQVHLDPAIVTFRGLRALIHATQSDSGFGCFYDSNSGELELVAAEGLSQDYIRDVHSIINGRSLVRFSVEQKEGVLIGNVQSDKRAARDIAKREGMKSTIVVPLMFEDEVLGAMVLFCRRANRYTEEDFNLVQAAANQIGLAVRQAESYVTEKQHASSLKTLYRLSHELTKLFSVREIVEHALPIIQEELACKRMWMGILNEQNSHLVGQAGYGPGVRQSIINMQVELALRHDFLDEAIKTKQPVIVGAGEKMECSGLNRMIERLELGALVIVPLVSLGQVVGVLIVEPAGTSSLFVRKKLPLLRSMVNEIATVILARRFEAKMADSDKMRMAGVLASGVAHNFNNLLQAVMGQASLIEMQVAENKDVVKSARTIVDAATKGAALIKQLLSFSRHGEKSAQKVISVNRMINESEELYRSVLGSEINLQIDSDAKLSPVLADPGLVQQVIMNLVVNAKEAIEAREDPQESGVVIISTLPLRIRSGEVDPELAPGHYLRIDVQDNGTGMNSERLQRCFEPFYTTKNVDASTGIGLDASGLGLSTAYSIVKQHEGVLTVRSRVGKGTVFSVYLPLQSSEVADAVEIKKSEYAQPKRKRREAIFLKLDQYAQAAMRTTLESFGLLGEILYSEDSVIQRIKKHAALVRLVIVDAERLTMKTSDLVEEILSIDPSISIVLLASSSSKNSELRKHKQVRIIEKPISVWIFRSLIQRIMDEEKELSVTREVTKDSKENGKATTSLVDTEIYPPERIH